MRKLRLERLERRDLMTGAGWTPHDQLLLELINRAREDPAAEAARYGVDLNQGLPAGTISSSAKQPLAPNAILMGAAAAHSQDMLDQDYFSHTNLAGQSPSDRAQAAGYPTWVGENIAWGGTTGTVNQVQHVFARHQNLFESAGHRQNMLRASYEEIGVGVRYGQFTTSSGNTYNASMVTEMFGNSGIESVITGVVFTDAADGSADDDDFYSVGEGATSGTVTATNSSTGAVFTAEISSTGGYAIAAGAGTYDVVATLGSGETYQATGVVVGSENVKIDFETTTAIAGGNVAPSLEPIADVLIPLNQTQVQIALTASDADGDPLTYAATIEPGVSGVTATVNGANLTLTMDQTVRDTFTVTVSVTDGLASDLEEFDVTKGIRIVPHGPAASSLANAARAIEIWAVGEPAGQRSATQNSFVALAGATLRSDTIAEGSSIAIQTTNRHESARLAERFERLQPGGSETVAYEAARTNLRRRLARAASADYEAAAQSMAAGELSSTGVEAEGLAGETKDAFV